MWVTSPLSSSFIVHQFTWVESLNIFMRQSRAQKTQADLNTSDSPLSALPTVCGCVDVLNEIWIIFSNVTKNSEKSQKCLWPRGSATNLQIQFAPSASLALPLCVHLELLAWSSKNVVRVWLFRNNATRIFAGSKGQHYMGAINNYQVENLEYSEYQSMKKKLRQK